MASTKKKKMVWIVSCDIWDDTTIEATFDSEAKAKSYMVKLIAQGKPNCYYDIVERELK